MKDIKDYKTKIDFLKSLKEMIYQNIDQIVDVLYEEMKKERYETILAEIIPTITEINFFIKKLNKNSFYKQKKWSFLTSYNYVYKPKGNVLIMNTWNYPFQLLFVPLIGSIASGNLNTIKLHPYFKKFNQLIKKLINEVDKEQQFIKFDQFDSIKETFENNVYDFVFFTGSYQTSKEILSYIDLKQTEYCFELGGKTPFVVTKSANIKKAAKYFCYAKLLNAGQTCIAPDYIFVDEKIADKFKLEVEKLVSKKLKNISKSNFYDKLILNNKKQEFMDKFTKNQTSINLIVEENNLNSDIYKKEIFAPFAAMYKYKNINEFQKLYELNPYPLSFYIFTKNKSDVFYLTNFIAGNYMINNTMMILEDNKLSFGGYKTSGNGRYRGEASLELFSNKSSLISKKGFDPLFKLKNYPYTKIKSKILNFYLKLIK